jgi:shikimate kinase
MKIFLIGMPGAGKSTLGKTLAENLMMVFFDLDKEIEKREGLPVQEIFHEKGEAYFREAEQEILRDITKQHHSFIMATGGGAPCFHQSMDFMLTEGKVLFLDISLPTLFARVQNSTDRPLLALQSNDAVMERLRKLREERLAIYQRANYTLEEKDLSLAKVMDLLLKTGNQQ